MSGTFLTADQVAPLVRERDALRKGLQDIVDDPIISEQLGMKRGVAQILAIAREALAEADRAKA